MKVIVCADTESVARTAADIVADYASRGATLGLATGSTPLATYAELIRRHREEDLSFAECTAFLLDEYIGLDRGNPQSYYRFIRDEFTSHIDISDERVHSLDGTLDSREELDAEAARYERAIADAGGVDLQILGVGANGHIGFNEPGSPLDSTTRAAELAAKTIADNSRFFDSTDEVPREVLTQGLGTIGRAGHLLLLATGANKAHAVGALTRGPVTPDCPASVLQLHPQATVVLDAEAATDYQANPR